MKKQLLGIVIGLGVMSILLAGQANAQTATLCKAHIPFAFTIGPESFAAGEYAISLVNPASNQNSLLVRNLADGQARLVMITPKEASAQLAGGKLIFNNYDGQYSLTEMATPALAGDFQRGKFERNLAKKQGRKPIQETLALF